MSRIFSALPARALHARPPNAFTESFTAVFLILVFGPMLGFLLALEPPGLLTDWQIRSTALTLSDGTVQGADCPTSDLMTFCDVTVTAPVGKDAVTRRLHAIFLYGADGPVRIKVVADPAHPAWLSTDLALDLFWNRVACLVGITLLLCGFIFGGGWAGWRKYKRGMAWRRADAVPVTLRLFSRQRLRRSQVWMVRAEDDKIARWTVPASAEPFALDATNDILGLRQLDGGAIMPLDAKLRWVDLSPAERATALGPTRR